MIATLDATTGAVETERGSLRLTHHQSAVLAAIVRRGGSAVAKGAILAEVWGPNEPDSHSALPVIISNIRRKLMRLGLDDDAIMTHRGFGYSAVGIQLARPTPLLLTARQRKELERMIDTHPDKNLAGRMLAAIGGYDP